MSDAANELRDPLGELTDEEFEKLSPAEKGARTKRAHELEADANAGDDDQDTTEAATDAAPEPAAKVSWITAGPDGKRIA